MAGCGRRVKIAEKKKGEGAGDRGKNHRKKRKGKGRWGWGSGGCGGREEIAKNGERKGRGGRCWQGRIIPKKMANTNP